MIAKVMRSIGNHAPRTAHQKSKYQPPAAEDFHESPLRIAIIGLGLIGGSLGLAIKQKHPSSHVIGCDRKKILSGALRRGAIDRGSTSLAEAVGEADIVFLCTPISSILRLLPSVARVIRPDAIVTDVGSVKNAICAKAAKLFAARGIFVGGHPMAGSEGSGIAYADALLFQSAVYVLCPVKGKTKRLQPLISLLKSIGARILVLDAGVHDEIAAAISHLPQLVAVGMVNLAAERSALNSGYQELAAGGFRDITRIASSPFPMWKDILAANRAEVKKVLRQYRGLLAGFENEIGRNSRSGLRKSFSAAKTYRDIIPKNSKGFLHPLHDISVWVEDKPGMLAKITSVLAKADINIADIELLKIREGEGGTFRLSFESREASLRALRVLRGRKFKVRM